MEHCLSKINLPILPKFSELLNNFFRRKKSPDKSFANLNGHNGMKRNCEQCDQMME